MAKKNNTNERINGILQEADRLAKAIAENEAEMTDEQIDKYAERLARITKAVDKSATRRAREAKKRQRIEDRLAKLEEKKATYEEKLAALLK